MQTLGVAVLRLTPFRRLARRRRTGHRWRSLRLRSRAEPGPRLFSACHSPASIRGQARTVPCGMTTPAMEERIMELMPEDAKAVLLLLARQLPYEVGQALDRIEGRRS